MLRLDNDTFKFSGLSIKSWKRPIRKKGLFRITVVLNIDTDSESLQIKDIEDIAEEFTTQHFLEYAEQFKDYHIESELVDFN